MCSLCSLVEAGPPRILLVEDEPGIRRPLRRYLEGRGCAVDEVADGAQALARLGGAVFDAVICDVNLPLVDGGDLWNWVVTHRPDLRSRFLFFSSPPLPAHLAAAGVVYLAKPAPLEALWAMLERVLRGRV